MRSRLGLFLMLALLPARGQESLAENIQRHLPGLMAHVPRDRSADILDPTSTPRWTSAYTFTPDTALIGHTAVFDPSSKVMTIFGGSDWGIGTAYTNAVLVYGPASGAGVFTTLISNGTSGSPASRALHSAVYDRAGNRMIIFGGAPETAGAYNDVWVLSNANGLGGVPVWTQLSPTGTLPAPRFSHTAVYDAKNNRMIVYGGYNGNYLTDVWVLSHANGVGGTPEWTQLAPSGAPPNGALYDASVYDPNNDIMITFGGEDVGDVGASNGVWTLSHASGLGGSPTWTNIVADGAVGSPAQRGLANATYDVANNRMMIFGGDTFSQSFSGPHGVDTGFNDVWVLANANGIGGTPAWTQLHPAGVLPGEREGQTAVYDANTNEMMIMGGDNGDAVYFSVWVLSHANGL